MGMANIAQSVNVISPLMTTKGGVVKQASWWPYLLFSKYMRGWTVALNVRGEEYEGRTNPAWVRGTIETPYLDCSATVSEDGWVALAVVNVHETKDYEVSLAGVAKGEVEVHTVTGANVQSGNMGGKQEVGVEESKWGGGEKFVFKKHSLTLLRWKDERAGGK